MITFLIYLRIMNDAVIKVFLRNIILVKELIPLQQFLLKHSSISFYKF